MLINTAESAIENVFLLIEDANPGLDLNTSNVTLGTPVAYDGSATDDNTQLTVTAIENAGHSGSIDVTYKRLSLEQAMGTISANYHNLTNTTEAAIKAELCDILNLVGDGGIVITDEVGGTVAKPGAGEVKLALIDVESTALLYTVRNEPYAAVLGDLAGATVVVNPVGTTVLGLELFTAFGSPTTAGTFVYINRGTLLSLAAGMGVAGLRITTAFPSGSKVIFINEGLIPGTARSSMVGSLSNVRGAISVVSSSGYTLEIQNAIGQIRSPGAMGEYYTLTDSTGGTTAIFPGGSGVGDHRNTAVISVSNTISGVTVSAVQEMTQGNLTSPGNGGIYDVTIDQGNGVVTGQILTGAGGQAGQLGGTASFTGFTDLSTLYPNMSLSKVTPVSVVAIDDPSGRIVWKSGDDSGHLISYVA